MNESFDDREFESLPDADSYELGEDEVGDVDDMVEVWRDDLLLDAIGGSDPDDDLPDLPLAFSASDRDLVHLLRELQRTAAESSPAIAVSVSVSVSESESVASAAVRYRRRTAPWMSAVAAATALFLGGVGLVAHEAAPGAPLWDLSRVLYSRHAESVEAGHDGKTTSTGAEAGDEVAASAEAATLPEQVHGRPGQDDDVAGSGHDEPARPTPAPAAGNGGEPPTGAAAVAVPAPASEQAAPGDATTSGEPVETTAATPGATIIGSPASVDPSGSPNAAADDAPGSPDAARQPPAPVVGSPVPPDGQTSPSGAPSCDRPAGDGEMPGQSPTAQASTSSASEAAAGPSSASAVAATPTPTPQPTSAVGVSDDAQLTPGPDECISEPSTRSPVPATSS